VQHSTGGYLLHAILTMQVHLRPAGRRCLLVYRRHWLGDWATPTLPMARWPCGGTQIVFEGVPTYPDAGRFWKMIQDHKVTIFYTAPTAIRSLIKAAETTPETAPQKLQP
jgi:acetyl-CoA synthetase